MIEFWEEFYGPGQDEGNLCLPERKDMEKKIRVHIYLFKYKNLIRTEFSLQAAIYFLENI